MRPLLLASALILPIQFLHGCSDDSSSGSSSEVPTVNDSDMTDELPGSGTIGDPAMPGSAICAIPPDLESGDSLQYRYTDASGNVMPISLTVASSDGQAIVLDVDEGGSLYRAAISTFCNDTPDLDIPGGEATPALQALFDQFESRPLLRQIVRPDFGRFDIDAEPVDLVDGEPTESCTTATVTAPIDGSSEVASYTCTYVYDAAATGNTVSVMTSLAQTRREIEDYGRLLEKTQSSTDGSVVSLELVTFTGAAD